jgi:hypothetical protein
MQQLKWLLLITGGALLLGFGSCYGLIRLASASRSCDRFNIDNIEVHALVNIPSVQSVTCHYNPDKQIKSNRFVLRTTDFDMNDFISRNGFKAISAPDATWAGVLAAATPSLQLPASGEFYANSGQRDTKRWYFLLDKSSATLWCALQY